MNTGGGLYGPIDHISNNKFNQFLGPTKFVLAIKLFNLGIWFHVPCKECRKLPRVNLWCLPLYVCIQRVRLCGMYLGCIHVCVSCICVECVNVFLQMYAVPITGGLFLYFQSWTIFFYPLLRNF